jgi:phosphoglycerate kinase
MILPSVVGFLMENEIKTLSSLLENPNRPFVALIGGAKISDKVTMLQNMISKVDSLLIGGGMAATFLKVEGYEIGKSLFEPDKLDVAIKIMRTAEDKKVRLELPIDAVVVTEIDARSVPQVVPVASIPKDRQIVDIGPQTIKNFSEELRRARTVFWNGPVGIYEVAPFARGTHEIARVVASLKAATIIGGGSTAEVVRELKLTDKMTFVSTGGGASLEFLSAGTLPGVEAIPDKKK